MKRSKAIFNSWSSSGKNRGPAPSIKKSIIASASPADQQCNSHRAEELRISENTIRLLAYRRLKNHESDSHVNENQEMHRDHNFRHHRDRSHNHEDNPIQSLASH